MVAKRRNPFTPTFGHAPFTFVGRDELIDDVIEGLSEGPGNPNRATIFLGPRGCGKTVLLSTIAHEALQMGWVCTSASTGLGMLQQLMEQLESNAGHLLVKENSSDITSLRVGPIGMGWEIRHNENATWRYRFQRVIEQLNDQSIGVLFIVDEVDASCSELIEFISFYQSFVTERRDVAMLLAGLPSKVLDLLVDDHVSFVRRAFQRKLAGISDADVREAVSTTVEDNGKGIEADALDMLVGAAQGFPYAMQLLGYSAWLHAKDGAVITCEDVEWAIERASFEMENSVIRPTLYECTSREVEYLEAMARDEGPSVTSDIAQRMGISMTNASNLRRRLMDRGIIASPRMGVVAFDMPVLETYLRAHSSV